MKIDNVAPVFLFITFWIVSALFKQNMKDKKGGGNSENNDKGISNLIKNAVESFATELEQKQNSNEELLESEPFYYKDLELEENGVCNDELENELQEQELVLDKLEKTVVKKTDQIVSDENYKVKQGVRNSKFSSKRLKEAFVWSEIINSPISLRD